MRKLTITLLCAAAAIAPGSALAQDSRGVYLALNAGISQVSDTEVSYYDVGGTFGGTGAQDRAETSADLASAAEFKGAFGYDFGVVRADLEVAYSRNRIDSLTVESLNGAPVTLTAADRQDVCDYLEVTSCGGSGSTFTFSEGPRLRQLAAMANLWVDLPIGGVIVPYAGGGIGVAGFELDGEGTGKFAWQLGAGVALNVSGSVSITADFRHRQVSGEDFPWDANAGFRVGRLKTSSFSAGLRFRF